MNQHSKTETERLFDKDAYIKEFETEVTECTQLSDGRFSVVLTSTAFFAEGGGQPSDTGILRNAETQINVLDVQEKDGIICHITDKPIATGKAKGEINFSVRYERMRNHSGEHLLSGFAHSLYGCTNVGFHLNDNEVTVDFDKQLSKEQLEEIERNVNRVIAENVRIKAYYPDNETLEKLEYRSKLEMTENVRIVEICGQSEGEYYDRCACCAPHVAVTSEIGILLITGSINYKGGTRLTMVCGENAYKISKNMLSSVKEIAVALSAKAAEVTDAFSRFMNQNENLKAKNSELCSAYTELRLSQLVQTDGDIVMFEPMLDKNSLRRLVDKSAELCSGKCYGFTGNDNDGWTYIIRSNTHDLKAESKAINEMLNGRGGGSSAMIQGSTQLSRCELEKILGKGIKK